jgi:hypothetical protein
MDRNLRIFLPTDVPILPVKVFPERRTVITVFHNPFSALIQFYSAEVRTRRVLRYIVPVLNYFPPDRVGPLTASSKNWKNLSSTQL